jgi:hypothetical protein
MLEGALARTMMQLPQRAVNATARAIRGWDG